MEGARISYSELYCTLRTHQNIQSRVCSRWGDGVSPRVSDHRIPAVSVGDPDDFGNPGVIFYADHYGSSTVDGGLSAWKDRDEDLVRVV